MKPTGETDDLLVRLFATSAGARDLARERRALLLFERGMTRDGGSGAGSSDAAGGEHGLAGLRDRAGQTSAEERAK